MFHVILWFCGFVWTRKLFTSKFYVYEVIKTVLCKNSKVRYLNEHHSLYEGKTLHIWHEQNGYTFSSQSTFHYNSRYWSNKTEYNLPGGETGFDSEETKLPTYWNTSFTKICLGMKIGKRMNFIVINKQANSLYSLIADGQYRPTSLGRNTWKTLIDSKLKPSLQRHCNKEGFNAKINLWDSRARIGIISNDKNQCVGCDSRIGFGTGGFPDNSNTCGNEAHPSPYNVARCIKATGYILIQWGGTTDEMKLISITWISILKTHWDHAVFLTLFSVDLSF